MERRDLRIDGLKYFLVCIVVVGHCIQPFRYDHAVTGWLYGIIYSFHMPLFVILSGFFFKIADTEKERKKCMRLLETFVVVTLVFWVSGGMSYSWPLIRIDGCPSWYLFSLVCWRAVSHVLLKKITLKKSFVASLVMSLVVYALLNKGEGMFGVMRTVQFYPYFLVGYAIKQGVIDIRNTKGWLLFLIATISLVVIVVTSSYALYTLEFQGIGMMHWSKMFNMSVLLAWGGYLFIKISSITISCTVWRIVKLPGWLSQFGSASLLMYSVHTMFLPLMYHYCTTIWQTALVGIVTIGFTMLLSKSKRSELITNPISVSTRILIEKFKRK